VIPFSKSAPSRGPAQQEQAARGDQASNDRGILEMTGQNVLYPGDGLTLWTDARTRQTRRVQVTTVFQGNEVDLTAIFKTLKSGLTYMAFGEAIVPAKELSVQTTSATTDAGSPAQSVSGRSG